MSALKLRAAAAAACLLAATAVDAQDDAMPADRPTADVPGESRLLPRLIGADWSYGVNGLTYDPLESPTSLWIGVRFQLRYDSLPGEFVSADDLRAGAGSEFDLNRGRIKGGGTLFREWLDAYSEYDFTDNRLLDLRATFRLHEQLSLRMGQWKAEYNRERIDSSGKQQFVERSLSNYWFTIDRQQGIGLTTEFLRETKNRRTRLYLEYLSGTGRGNSFDSDAGLWLARIMWSPSGTELPYSQSGLKRYEQAVQSVAIAAVTGRTPYTRFSSAGGGSLPGYDVGDYDLTQYLLETAFQYRGLSWQQELHFKRIRDRMSGDVRELTGGYLQFGAFLDQVHPRLPKHLEFAGRVSIVDPDRDASSDTQREWTVGVNWFFHGHRNKITADFSWLDYDDPVEGADDTRFRLQWELSL